MLSKLKNIKDCDFKHCLFHFPQFEKFREDDLKRDIQETLILNDDSYYHRAYANWKELNDKYQEIYDLIDKDFIQACELLMSLYESSYIRYDLYLDCQNGVAKLNVCCA